ncbi:aluminum-activated malate transporter 9-like [Mangifera indica]|uniref:aluminum-activated malate transporter 9-like n=1 Tax=Mangifera indica TaxID=29780 RepID=UPI001CFA20E8|nr:aluminum-activated malate transporter 9-like [Mangifera indica]
MATRLGALRAKLVSVNGYSELGSSVAEFSEADQQRCCCSCRVICDKITSTTRRLVYVFDEAVRMGKSDPRKIVFAAKMGLALIVISLLIFLKEPVIELNRYYVWAILTVVVVFEFSIGATLSKGLNRGLGTLSAGGLALAMAELSELAREWDEVLIVTSIFIIGFLASYAKLYPTMKPYEYGFRVFLLTYCNVMVSGYRTREFIHTAVSRFWLIALGAGVGLVVNICIYPIWAGEDLHNLVAKNFRNVATSLEGCIKSYLSCTEIKRVPSKILTYQAADDPVYSGYRSAIESKSQEDALMGFAVWEPPHGPYKSFKYPWKNYVNLSGALRHCAFIAISLHGCILSEIQAPEDQRELFRHELQRVGIEGAKVLRELANKVKRMEKLGPVDILYEVHKAAEELLSKVDRKSYVLVNAESWEIGTREKVQGEPQELLNFVDEENKVLEYKSRSEAALDLRSVRTDFGVKSRLVSDVPSENKIQMSWPARISCDNNAMPQLKTSKTYESASALSLATFASLLIEFVARLQNVVNAFEELSEKANFKEPDGQSAEEAAQPTGLWRWLNVWSKAEASS